MSLHNYFESLGLDAGKLCQIFLGSPGFANEADSKRIKATQHYAKVEAYVLEDTPGEEVMIDLFQVEGNQKLQSYSLLLVCLQYLISN